jgi:hypothetical protein
MFAKRKFAKRKGAVFPPGIFSRQPYLDRDGLDHAAALFPQGNVGGKAAHHGRELVER